MLAGVLACSPGPVIELAGEENVLVHDVSLCLPEERKATKFCSRRR